MSTVGYYALWIALHFVLPGALLCCEALAMRHVAAWLRNLGLVLLGVGAVVIILAARSTGVGGLMPSFAAPALISAAVVFPFAGVALVRSAASSVGRISSTHAASTLLILAAVIQFFAPWLLVSGE